MSSNPWTAGNFFEQFVTDSPEFIFRDPIADQRQCILLEIAAIKQTTLMAFSAIAGAEAYFYVDTLGVLQSFLDLQDFTNTNDITWLFFGGSTPPGVIVMTDENNDPRYIEPQFTNPPTLDVLSAPSGTFSTVQDTLFVGSFFELIGENGISIYRVTVQSDNTLHVDFNRDEPERIQSITVSNGHPFAFRVGRTFIEALIQLGDVNTDVPVTEIGFGGITTQRIGMIKLSLHDQYYDFLTDQDWDNRHVTIMIGATDVDTILYNVALRGKTKSASWDQNTISITLQDAGLLFDRSVHDQYYLGTGGYEGDIEIEGRIKPLLYGFVTGIDPVLVDENLSLYQWHDGPAHQVFGVSQGGVLLFFLGDFPETLLTWIPTPTEIAQGGWRSDFNRGMFRLAAPPGGRIVATSARGDAQLSTFGTISEIVQRLIQIRLPELTMDQASFDDFNAQRINQAGVYFSEEITLRQALTEIMETSGAALSLDRLGEVRANSLHRSPARAFIMESEGTIIDGSIQREEAPKPAAIYRFGYNKSWTVLTETDFLGGAEPNLRALLSVEYRYDVQGPFESAIANRTPTATTKTVNTFFTIKTETTLFGNRIRLREQSQRDIYSMIVEGLSWKLRIGDTVMVQLLRWRLQVPRAFIVIGINERSPTTDVDNLTTLRLWG